MIPYDFRSQIHSLHTLRREKRKLSEITLKACWSKAGCHGNRIVVRVVGGRDAGSHEVCDW